MTSLADSVFVFEREDEWEGVMFKSVDRVLILIRTQSATKYLPDRSPELVPNIWSATARGYPDSALMDTCTQAPIAEQASIWRSPLYLRADVFRNAHISYSRKWRYNMGGVHVLQVISDCLEPGRGSKRTEGMFSGSTQETCAGSRHLSDAFPTVIAEPM